MTLPRQLGDREYQKFVENADGEVAQRVAGGVHLENAAGQDVEFIHHNGKYDLANHDTLVHKTMLDLLAVMREIRDELKVITE